MGAASPLPGTPVGQQTPTRGVGAAVTPVITLLSGKDSQNASITVRGVVRARMLQLLSSQHPYPPPVALTCVLPLLQFGRRTMESVIASIRGMSLDDVGGLDAAQSLSKLAPVFRDNLEAVKGFQGDADKLPLGEQFFVRVRRVFVARRGWQKELALQNAHIWLCICPGIAVNRL